MRSTNAVTQRLAPRGSLRTRGGRIATSARLMTAGLVAAGSMTALVVAESTPASASTLNGIASVADPITLNVVTSGASTTPFTVSLPPQAACDGDTATNGYHVYSYLVPSGTTLSGVTFQSFPSSGFGLVDDIGTYYGPVNTAIGTGQVVSIPNGFEWGPLVSNDGVPLSTLLYTGSGSSASGVWEAGLVCANNSGVVADNWNTEVTFHAASGDANGFNWTAVPGPSGSAPAAFTSANSATFTQGFAGTFTPTASGSPTPAITESGTLPAGVHFTGGVLSGTPSVSGTFPITLTATNGIEAAAKQSFTLNVATAIPNVTGIAPSAGPTAGGTSVVITGTNLGSATTVNFGANPGTITADSSTSVTATAPAGTAGPVDITVATPGGTSTTSANDLFTYVAAPTVTGIAPTAGPSSGGTSVVISGTNLGSATAVNFGATPGTITADSSTSVTATAPAGSAGLVDVTVTTAGGTSSTSANDQYAYVAAPTVTGIAPTAGPTAGGTPVVITGTGLGTATAVNFGGNPATITADSATSVTATAPPGSTGPVDVTVTALGGTSATSANDLFTYGTAPAVTGIAPNAGPTAGGTSAVITGTNLGSATAVAFGGNPAAITADSATSVTATAPPGTSGPVDVTVTTPDGTSATSANDQFTYAAVPAVTGVAPAAGPTAGSTSVVITGTGLGSASVVDFGGAPATITADSSTSVTATAPAGSAGPVDVTVTTPGGTSATSANDQYTYVAAPTVTGIAPTAGPTAGGTSVVITGTNLGSATAVDFGANPAAITADSSTSVTATAPAGSVGSVHVTVTTAGGTSATSANDQFTYGTVPVFTSANSTAFTKKVTGTFTPTASGSPAPVITESGALPNGVTFSAGVLSGKPTVTGSFPITFTATNGIGSPVTQSFTLTVWKLRITTTSLPTAVHGAAYAAQLAETGAKAPVTWSSDVKLPKGLKLNAATGAISGTTSAKAAVGSFPITFTVTDGTQIASATITLKVKA